MIFRSYNNTSEYFFKDYVAIAIAIVRLVTTIIFTCEDIYVICRLGGPYSEKL